MRKLFVVAGTRPEVIKLAPLLLEARDRPSLHVRFCLTGQHSEMADEPVKMFGLQPDVHLKIMKVGQSPNDICRRIFASLPAELESYRPDIVVVQGDTSSAMAAALVAFHERIPVAHVEAGLRSGDLNAPFPEEANRRCISAVSRYHFSPTDGARQNLLNEGHARSTVWVTGNTVVDALSMLATRFPDDPVTRVHSSIREPFALVTVHRRESHGEGMIRIATALASAARRLPRLTFVFPVHVHPAVRSTMESRLSNVPNILLLPPVSYRDLLALMKACAFIITDSGGIQEEAPTFGKYCIVLRRVTERTEGLAMGFAELAGDDPQRIETAIHKCSERREMRIHGPNPYGDGHAAQRILDVLEAG